MTTSVLPSLLALLAILALVPVALYLARRIGGASVGGSGPIAVRASLAVGPRERLIVIEAAGKWLLVGVTAQSMQTLAEYDEPPIIPSSEPARFASLLASARRAHRD